MNAVSQEDRLQVDRFADHRGSPGRVSGWTPDCDSRAWCFCGLAENVEDTVLGTKRVGHPLRAVRVVAPFPVHEEAVLMTAGWEGEGCPPCAPVPFLSAWEWVSQSQKDPVTWTCFASGASRKNTTRFLPVVFGAQVLVSVSLPVTSSRQSPEPCRFRQKPCRRQVSEQLVFGPPQNVAIPTRTRAQLGFGLHPPRSLLPAAFFPVMASCAVSAHELGGNALEAKTKNGVLASSASKSVAHRLRPSQHDHHGWTGGPEILQAGALI